MLHVLADLISARRAAAKLIAVRATMPA